MLRYQPYEGLGLISVKHIPLNAGQLKEDLYRKAAIQGIEQSELLHSAYIGTITACYYILVIQAAWPL